MVCQICFVVVVALGDVVNGWKVGWRCRNHHLNDKKAVNKKYFVFTIEQKLSEVKEA